MLATAAFVGYKLYVDSKKNDESLAKKTKKKKKVKKEKQLKEIGELLKENETQKSDTASSSEPQPAELVKEEKRNENVAQKPQEKKPQASVYLAPSTAQNSVYIAPISAAPTNSSKKEQARENSRLFGCCAYRLSIFSGFISWLKILCSAIRSNFVPGLP